MSLDINTPLTAEPAALYVHIPFCVSKCAYCDFNSSVPKSKKQIRVFVEALLEDIRISSLGKREYLVKSIYLGGGTPSFIDPEYIKEILGSIRENFNVRELKEVTIEVNPESVSPEKLSIYKKNGINRISMGVQSFNDKNLRGLGRAHNAKDVFCSIKLIKKAGFEKASIDLMYGLPGQTLTDWEIDLNTFLDTGIPHISFYDLKIEKGTPFYFKKKDLKVADNDLQARMYKLGCSKLTKAGLTQYEISSFGLKGQESMHNSVYWKNETYLGLGAGAYSYLQGRRFAKAKNIDKYIDQAKAGEFRRYSQEKLGKRERLIETIILKLRLLKGFSLTNVEKKLGIKADAELLDKINELKKQKLILSSRGKYRLSKKGLLFYDTLASELL